MTENIIIIGGADGFTSFYIVAEVDILNEKKGLKPYLPERKIRKK